MKHRIRMKHKVMYEKAYPIFVKGNKIKIDRNHSFTGEEHGVPVDQLDFTNPRFVGVTHSHPHCRELKLSKGDIRIGKFYSSRFRYINNTFIIGVHNDKDLRLVFFTHGKLKGGITVELQE